MCPASAGLPPPPPPPPRCIWLVERRAREPVTFVPASLLPGHVLAVAVLLRKGHSFCGVALSCSYVWQLSRSKLLRDSSCRLLPFDSLVVGMVNTPTPLFFLYSTLGPLWISFNPVSFPENSPIINTPFSLWCVHLFPSRTPEDLSLTALHAHVTSSSLGSLPLSSQSVQGLGF